MEPETNRPRLLTMPMKAAAVPLDRPTDSRPRHAASRQRLKRLREEQRHRLIRSILRTSSPLFAESSPPEDHATGIRRSARSPRPLATPGLASIFAQRSMIAFAQPCAVASWRTRPRACNCSAGTSPTTIATSSLANFWLEWAAIGGAAQTSFTARPAGSDSVARAPRSRRPWPIQSGWPFVVGCLNATAPTESADAGN